VPIYFQCPNCRAKYDVAEDMVGKTMLCRECEQRVAVPASAAAAKPVHPALKAAAASTGEATRRSAILIGVASFLPGALLGWLGGYFWKRQLPWEGGRSGRREDSADGEQPADGQQADGQQRGGGRQRGGGGGRQRGGGGGRQRGGGNGQGQMPQGGQNPPAPNPPMENPPMS
jgi:hypothetical protein